MYIGKLVAPKRAIREEDDDRAHIDEEASKIIHYMQATNGHEYMVDAILKQDQGLTFDVFNDEPVAEVEPQFDEDGNQLPAPIVDTNIPKFIYVKEVVREPRLHFYKVPRLGSYLAIRLEYNSCLFEEALETAVHDYNEVRLRQKE